jgi:hypothetical protein
MRWDADLPGELVDKIWNDPHAMLDEGERLQLKWRCTVTRLDHAAGPFVWKHHNWGSLRRTVGQSLSQSAARKSWMDADFLYKAGVPTPRPRAYLERRFGPFQNCSYLLIDFVPGTSLYRFMRYERPSTSAVRDLARQVAAIWQQLDELCVWHNDFKTENLLIDLDGKVWIIDFEKMRRFRDRDASRRRQIHTARQLLHPRNWRKSPWAAEIFRQEIANTPAARELLASPLGAGHPLGEPIPPDNAPSQLVTVLIPCRNSAKNVTGCIESVRDMADEILIADSGSTDETLRVVQQLGGCRVVQRRPDDRVAFAAWAHQQATHPWVLQLLPNERLTPELSKQVQDVVATEPEIDAYRIPRRACVNGHFLKHTGPSGAPIRLYRKDAVRFELRNGHVEVNGSSLRVGRLPSCLTYDDSPVVDEAVPNILRFPARSPQQAGRRAA